MNHVLFFVFQRQRQLLRVCHGQIKVYHKPPLVFRYLIEFYLLRFQRQRTVIVRIMQLFRVLEVYLQNPAFLRIPLHLDYLLCCWHHTLPVKSFLRQRQAHCPSVEVVDVQISDVVRWLSWLISFNSRVACLCLQFAHHRYAAPHSLLDEQTGACPCLSATPILLLSSSAAYPNSNLARFSNAPGPAYISPFKTF